MEKETKLSNPSPEFVADHELLGDKLDTSHDEAIHLGALTEEELEIEKKLKKKIDLYIMPYVVGSRIRG